MKNITKKIGLVLFAVLAIGFVQSCKNKNPSVIKIFVRSSSNELVEGAKVVIIGDPDSNPATNAYVDTIITNGSGFAYFDVQSYYDEAGEDATVAYFDVIAKKDPDEGTGYIRSRVHTTAVETIFFPN